MTKTYKFTTSNNNNSTFFLNSTPKYTNYSEILDDIISADVIKKNDYLFDTYTSPIIIGSNLKNDKFINAAKFLANYKKNKKTYLPFTLGKMYELNDGTRIVFYDDEIMINADVYKYSDFLDFSFLNGLSTNTKKTIINIYTAGAGDIEINLL